MFGDEKRLRLLTDSLKEGVLVVNRDGDIVFWSKGAEALLGFAEEEVLGRNPVSMMAAGPLQEHLRRAPVGIHADRGFHRKPGGPRVPGHL